MSAEKKSNRAIPELSVDTQVLLKVLVGHAKVDEVIPWEVFDEAIRRDVRETAMHLMATARKLAEREHGMVFAAVKGEGLKLLGDEAKARLYEGHLHRERRATKRVIQRMATVNYDALSPEAQVEHNLGMSMLSALHQATRPAAVKKLKAAVSSANEQLAMAKTLEMFMK